MGGASRVRGAVVGQFADEAALIAAPERLNEMLTGMVDAIAGAERSASDHMRRHAFKRCPCSIGSSSMRRSATSSMQRKEAWS